MRYLEKRKSQDSTEFDLTRLCDTSIVLTIWHNALFKTRLALNLTHRVKFSTHDLVSNLAERDLICEFEINKKYF